MQETISYNSAPLISVIVPVYNVERYIQNTLVSLDGQTFRDFEIILVDDGSQDASIKIASSHLEGSDVPWTVVTQKNQGSGIARNAGVEASRGEWIYFLDSDDAIQPFTFEGFSRLVCVGDAPDIIFTKFQTVSEDDVFKVAKKHDATTAYGRDELLRLFLLREIVPLVPGTLYSKRLLVKNGISHEALRWSEDQHFMWRVLAHLDTAVFWDCVTYNYCQHAGSIMSSTPAERIIDAYARFLELPAEVPYDAAAEFLVPRWVLGSLHATAPRMGYRAWRGLFDALGGARNIKKLGKFPAPKVRLLSRIGAISPKLLYIAFGGGRNAS